MVWALLPCSDFIDSSSLSWLILLWSFWVICLYNVELPVRHLTSIRVVFCLISGMSYLTHESRLPGVRPNKISLPSPWSLETYLFSGLQADEHLVRLKVTHVFSHVWIILGSASSLNSRQANRLDFHRMLELIYLYFPPFFLLTVENKGKLILTEIFPSEQKHDI